MCVCVCDLEHVGRERGEHDLGEDEERHELDVGDDQNPTVAALVLDPFGLYRRQVGGHRGVYGATARTPGCRCCAGARRQLDHVG